jgi:hypothetical protein
MPFYKFILSVLLSNLTYAKEKTMDTAVPSLTQERKRSFMRGTLRVHKLFSVTPNKETDKLHTIKNMKFITTTSTT